MTAEELEIEGTSYVKWGGCVCVCVCVCVYKKLLEKKRYIHTQHIYTYTYMNYLLF